jgi:uncharacterized protein
MKLLLAFFLMCLAISASARAQQSDADAPASKEDVEAYLAVTHSKGMAEKMMAAMATPMHQMIHEQYLKNKEKLPPDFETRMNKQMDDMMKNMPFAEMLDAMVPIYQKHLTKGDVTALVTFYSSPTGQKILKEMPAITAEALQNMMPVIQKYATTMQERVQQQVAQMLQQAAPAPAKNPAPTAN